MIYLTYITYILLAYLSIAVIYYLIYSFASRFTLQPHDVLSCDTVNSIAVFIPAYKEDAIIYDTASRALGQLYPHDSYRVFVIADSLKSETLAHLRTLPIEVVEVSFEKSTKARAINKTYEMIGSNYQITVVLDADNVMEPNFLQKVNEAYNAGAEAMQGHRVAKNENNSMAILDGISEEINNHIFRKGHRNLGLSSALIGSGMAFDFQVFKEYMSRIDAIGGFDKELELSLLRDGVSIDYLEDALVFDEKVSKAEVFTNQRTRWIAAQIRYGMSSFGESFIQLFKKGNFDYFDKSFQFLLPPRLILLGVLVILAALTTVLGAASWTYTVGLLALYVLALLLAVPGKYFNTNTLLACFTLPRTFFMMVYAISGYKKAKTNFLHTPHQNS